MYGCIIAEAEGLLQKAAALRRDFHQYPETGWLEIRTASKVAGMLYDMGYEVLTGSEVCDGEARLGLPSACELERHYDWAAKNGADPRYIDRVSGGYTGVIGILRCGKGPVLALRFDMDALKVEEDRADAHAPFRLGFCSRAPGVMHACGHDGHTAIGLCVAELLMKLKDRLHGTVKLVFQPAEEGVRGASSIVKKGCLDDVDYIFAGHVYPKERGDDSQIGIFSGKCGAMATAKLDVSFTGRAAHAGMFPELGRNAMLAAANAILNLYAIPRRGDAATQVNVGYMKAGGQRNVICGRADLEMEVRGETTAAKDYMEECAERVIKNAAEMYGCGYDISVVGRADALHNSPELSDLLRDICCEELALRTEYVRGFGSGSEDFACMAERVIRRGGKSLYFHILSSCAAPNHSSDFDFEESAMAAGIKVFGALVYKLLGNGGKDYGYNTAAH